MPVESPAMSLPGLFLFLCILLVPLPVVADRIGLSDVEAARQAGAPAYAIRLLDTGQPAISEHPESWFRWERVRIRILVDTGAHDRALEQLRNFPSAAGSTARTWAREQRAELHLQRGEPADARAVVRDLFIRSTVDDLDAIPLWRRLIIRSYLLEGAIDNAVLALRRYDQDYPAADSEWHILRARVLLQADAPAEALGGLPDAGDPELQALRLMAEARAEARSVEAVLEEALARANAEGVRQVARARFLAVAAEAAAIQEGQGRRAQIVEQALPTMRHLPTEDTLFLLTGDDLWDAWLARGRAVANRDQLLLGDDEGWFAAAEAAWPQYQVSARALLATVALRGHDDSRDEAHRRLMQRLQADDGPGLAVLRVVYLDSERFPELTDLPVPVQYELVDAALAENDIDMAVRLMAELPAAPDDTNPFEWQLLRSRVLVVGGQPQAGAEVLHELLDENRDLPQEFIDRIMQVLFDLQAAEAHDEALALFAEVGQRDLDDQRRRELLYWQAESYESMDNYTEAASHYLRSATLVDGRGGDPWGQTARYQAARMLTELGLVNDARRIYEVLLRVTDDPSRRTQLRTRLRELGRYDASAEDLPLHRE